MNILTKIAKDIIKMVLKLVNATELRRGSYILIDNLPCEVKKIDISKTGKHGHAKVRIEAIGVIDEKKRVIVKPGHEKFAVPLIEKKKGQILTVNDKTSIASIMDIESYETIDAIIPSELHGKLKEGAQVEYWDIEGQRIVKRAL